MSKSHVAMESHVCVACGKAFETGSILLSTQVNRFTRELATPFEDGKPTVTGWGMCPEHQANLDEGRVLLVAVDASKSTHGPDGKIMPEDAFRTGAIAAIRGEAFDRIFNVPRPTKGVAFCDQEVIDRLQEMAPAE